MSNKVCSYYLYPDSVHGLFVLQACTCISCLKVLSDLVDLQVWHLITDCHFCADLTPTIVTILKTCPNMTLAVEVDVKPNFIAFVLISY